MKEMTRVATNGSWVTMIMKTRAGISGARRAHALLRALRDGCGSASVGEVVCSATEVMAHPSRAWYRSATSSASRCPRFRASSTDIWPAIAELTYCDTWVPRSVNSGMSTNWMPIAGRGWTPGLRGSAPERAASVGGANAAATTRYWWLLYVESALPAGTLDKPTCCPTSSSYWRLDAQEMNFQALSF